jgi:ABC-type multidrug transport system fused ATPase/permease subunit
MTCTMASSTLLSTSQAASVPKFQCSSSMVFKGKLTHISVGQMSQLRCSWQQLTLHRQYKNFTGFRTGAGESRGSSTSWKIARRNFCGHSGRLKVTNSSSAISLQEFTNEEKDGHKEWQLDSARLIKYLPCGDTFKKVVPFMYSELGTILKGWACCCVAVGCLFFFVPEVGKLSALLSQGDLPQLGRKIAFLAMLVSTRSVVQYWQQAFLWEAVLNVTYKVRSYVYEKVLQRDMTFFEGRHAVAAGDVAFRITTESEDMGDTVYSLIHVKP